MINKYPVQIIEIDPIIEELVVLEVNGTILRCFVSHCPSAIEAGKTYEVEFDMVLPNELRISKIQNENLHVEMLENGFSCEIYGYLDGDTFKSVVEFPDQGIHFEYPHLNGHFVKITAERIDVSFSN